MIIRTHDDYVSFAGALRWQASMSPNSPWTEVTLTAETGAPNPWSLLAEWQRATERSFYAPSPPRLGTVARLALPALGDTLPPAQILAAIIEAARSSPERLFLVELAALALRSEYMGPALPQLLEAFIDVSDTCSVEHRLRWIHGIAPVLPTPALLGRLLASVPPQTDALDLEELTLIQLRFETDAARAIAWCEQALPRFPANTGSLEGADPGGSEHRRALHRLHLLQELSFRANAADLSDIALRNAKQAFQECAAIGLPSFDADPQHNFSGFDLAAQLSAADWVHAAVASDTSVGNQVLLSHFNPRSEENVAVNSRRRLFHGRFQTDYDGLVELLDNGARAALEQDIREAHERHQMAIDLADRLRCFSLWSIAMTALARSALVQFRGASTAEERAEYARTALVGAARAGDRKIVEEAAEGLQALAASDVGTVLATMPHQRIVERTARLTAMRELAPVLPNADLERLAEVSAEESLNGPFSMQGRRDVKRAAIRAAACVLREAAGLRDASVFERVCDVIVSSWERLIMGNSDRNPLVVHEVSEALLAVLSLPPGRFSADLTKRILAMSSALPRGRAAIHDGAWLNFVRPSIEFVLAQGVTTPESEALRREILEQIPVPKLTPPEDSGLPVEYPPDQQDMLPMTYRCLLGAPPDNELIHDVVERMMRYCRHFADGSQRRGLRMPIGVGLALTLAPYGHPGDHDGMLSVVVDMCMSRPLGAGPRREAVGALRDWLQRPGAPEGAVRLGHLERCAPSLVDSLLADLETGSAVVADEPPWFGSTNTRGALLVLCTDVVLMGVDSKRPRAAEAVERLAKVVEKMSTEEDLGPRGSARNVGALLLLEPATSERARERLAVLFLSSVYEREDDIVVAALQGFRAGVMRDDAGAVVDPALLEIMALHLAERAHVGAGRVRREARLTVRALRESSSPGGLEGAFARAQLSEADERAWRRVRAVQRVGREGGR